MGMFDGITAMVGSSTGAVGLGTAASIAGTIYQNEQNRQAAGDERDWATAMRATGYQATVADLMKAGLNPMLAYGRGATATPTGAQAAPSENPGTSVMANAAKAMELKGMDAQVEKTKAETENVRADTLGKLEMPSLYKAQTAERTEQLAYLNAQQLKMMVERDKLKQEIQNLHTEQERVAYYNRYIQPLERELRDIENRLKRYEEPEASARAESWRGTYGERIRPYLRDAGEIMGTVSSAVGAGAAARFLTRGIAGNRGINPAAGGQTGIIPKNFRDKGDYESLFPENEPLRKWLRNANRGR